MASNVFCKVDGIPGESTDDKHKDYFEVLSYTHGQKQQAAGSVSGTGAHVAGRVDHDTFTVVKHIDKATPKLSVACSKGEHIKSVVIECFRHLGENVKFMEYKLTDCIVKSHYPSGGSEGLPTETVSFSYAKIEWSYTQYDNKGKKQGEVKTSFDLEHQKAG